MDVELEKILINLTDAGCERAELKEAARLFESGDTEALIRHLRKCRCSRMAELHESQRKVDRLDYLIRQTAKSTR